MFDDWPARLSSVPGGRFASLVSSVATSLDCRLGSSGTHAPKLRATGASERRVAGASNAQILTLFNQSTRNPNNLSLEFPCDFAFGALLKRWNLLLPWRYRNFNDRAGYGNFSN